MMMMSAQRKRKDQYTEDGFPACDRLSCLATGLLLCFEIRQGVSNLSCCGHDVVGEVGEFSKFEACKERRMQVRVHRTVGYGLRKRPVVRDFVSLSIQQPCL